ncbi:MAG: FtsL-like putative cell division protein [Flavobacteriaceae bacterium]|nr:FtsL-like putative cell division protein [Flavobacteriaceae bacterium]
MPKKKNKSNISIKDILKGKFLVEEGSFNNWRFVFFLAVLAFISISSSHWADKKVIEIRKLQREVSDLKSEYSDIHKDLMQSQMESFVAEKVAIDSIKKSNIQPILIQSHD